MRKTLLLLFYLSLFAAKAQNGFTTYTTNLTITGSLKFQKALLVDNSGNKWIGFQTIIGAPNAGLVKYDNLNWTLYNKTSSPAFPSNNVTSLAKDNIGNIWIGCDSGLVKFDGITFTTYNTAQGLPMKFVNCVEVVGNQVYVGTNKGLSRFNGVSFTNYNVAGGTLPNDTIKCIKSEMQNLIWLGGRNHMVEFSINGSFVSSYTDHIISNNPGVINCIHIDFQNVKWLGTNNIGVLRYTGSTFDNANLLYNIFGSIIPSTVLDIAEGLHNGIVFRHAPGTSGITYNSSGLTELAPNNKVFQYFYPVSTFTLGALIEKDGSKIIGSYSSGSAVPKIYYSFSEANYMIPYGFVNQSNYKALDINQISAGIGNRSYMHGFDIDRSNYRVPKGTAFSTLNGAALWVEGMDAANQLHGGAQLYAGVNGGDFWPGPLDTVSSMIDTLTSISYDKVWKVSYTDINNFITAFNSGSVIATSDMLSWPAHGTGNNSRNLAPFIDHNNDGTYNPYDGDYPEIKGDQAIYFIYNDMLSAHGSSFTPMGIEVQGMAYAYGCAGVLSGKNELAYTTFYDYKIINRSANNYHDVNLSLWCKKDFYDNGDYFGSNVSDNYSFIYHQDTIDEDGYNKRYKGYGAYPPAQGIKILKGPIANPSDGLDNDNNGAIDESDEECKLNKVAYYNNGIICLPGSATGAPTKAGEFYKYMNGFWIDSTHITCGGNGYGGTVSTNWMYPGDPVNTGVTSDPNNTCGMYWKESGVPGGRTMILSSGPFNLNAGQMQEVEYAFVTSFDSSSTTNSNLLSVAKLKTDMQKVTAFYNQANKPNCLQTIDVGLKKLVNQNDFLIYPNPAQSKITVTFAIDGAARIKYDVVDVLGKVVIANEDTGSDKFSINISDLNSGIYFLRLQANNSVVVKKFVKE